MSRSGYSEDCEHLVLWRQAVENATSGKRGQVFMHDLVTSLEAMPEKRLIRNHLKDEDGEVCALGAVGARRGMDLELLDPEDPDSIGKAFGIAACLAREIVYENDEHRCSDTPEQRWTRIHSWAKSQLKPYVPSGTAK